MHEVQLRGNSPCSDAQANAQAARGIANAQSLMGCSSSLPTTTVDLADAGVQEGQRSWTQRRSSEQSSRRRSSLDSRSSVFRKSRMEDVKQPMDLASEAYDRGKARFDKGDQEAALVEFMECQALVVAEQKRRRGTLEMKLVKARQSSRERRPWASARCARASRRASRAGCAACRSAGTGATLPATWASRPSRRTTRRLTVRPQYPKSRQRRRPSLLPGAPPFLCRMIRRRSGAAPTPRSTPSPRSHRTSMATVRAMRSL